MLTVITGIKGAGKTSLCTQKCFTAYKHKETVYANYKLKFPFKKINLEFILTHPELLHHATLAIDEAQLWMDCRLSHTKENRLIGYLVLQSRKRNLHVILTSQQIENLDIRVRRNTDVLATCYPFSFNNEGKLRLSSIEQIEGRLVDKILIVEENLSMNALRKYIFDPHFYFKLYDSDEFIDITI